MMPAMDEPRRRRRRTRSGSTLQPWLSDRFLGAGLVLLVLLSMLLVGAVHVPVILALSLLALPLGAVALKRLEIQDRLGPRSPIWILVGLALFSVIQAVPLPDGLSAWLAPQSHAVWGSSLRALGQLGPAWHSLSIDTGATWIEAAKWFTYAATFAAALALSSRGRAAILVSALFGSAVLAALISAVHLAVGATRLYGIYEPQFAVTPWRVAPLLNPNNLSGYLLLGIFAGFSLVLMRRPALPRPVLLVTVAATLAVLILTGSRGGVLACAVGIGLFIGYLLISGRGEGAGWSRGARPKILLGLAAVGVAGVGFAALAAGEQTWVALQDESFSKLSVVGWTRGLIADNWLLGVGRGAFETAFPPYRAGFGRMLFQYPENFFAQWLSEWGVVVSLLAFGGFFWSIRPWRLLAGATSNVALCFGMVALLVQNLVDLGLEVMSVGIAFSVALGTVVGSSWRSDPNLAQASETSSEAGKSRVWLRLRAPLLGGIALVANIMGWVSGTHTAVADRESMRASYEALTESQAAAADFGAQLRAAILRHPGDSYLPLLGALAANRFTRDPIAWINRALERDPERGATHFLLAEVLIGHGSVSQGMLALRFAVQRQPEFLGRAATLAVDRARQAQDVWASVPEGAEGVPMLLALARAADRAKKPQVESRALVEEATHRDPQSKPARLEETRRLLRDLTSADKACSDEQRSRCLARLDSALRVLESGDDLSAEIILAGARRRALEGHAAEASRFLAERCSRLHTPAECFREQVGYALQAGDAALQSDAITAYLAAACESTAACAKAAAWIGDRLQERGDMLGAIAYYSRAAKETPTRAMWQKLAAATKAAGQMHSSQEAEQRARDTADAPP
jgi:tetratricopeptide (TPR) repeat protein